MDIGIDVFFFAVTLNIIVIFLIYSTNRRKLKKQIGKYNSISDTLNNLQSLINNAKKSLAEENKNHESIKQNSKELANKIELLENKRKSIETETELLEKELNSASKKFNEINSETQKLQTLLSRENELNNSIQDKTESIHSLNKKIKQLDKDKYDKHFLLQEIMTKIDLYTRIEGFIDHGSYEIPEYLYETSKRYAEEIKIIREQQRDMIKDNSAIIIPNTTTISDDPTVNKRILSGQSRLMLTAFNIECDTLIGKVKPSTFTATLERIEKLANSLEKSAGSLACGFNIEYIKLKFKECRFQYQFTLKKQEEFEEQRAIREQIREEQKAIKEYERAVAEAEKEEEMYRQLLDKAREELQTITKEERAAAEARILALEQQLSEAEAKEARAKSMAEQTRKGHVYVISNVGSFGKGIYKIGLTRRLDPMDRVKELGDASVPFSFDVHAMIYVDDAPALERDLHREFSSHRVNLINQRKEFFQVDLSQVEEAVSRISGLEAEFKTTIAAEEYYESQRLRGVKIEETEALH